MKVILEVNLDIQIIEFLKQALIIEKIVYI